MAAASHLSARELADAARACAAEREASAALRERSEAQEQTLRERLEAHEQVASVPCFAQRRELHVHGYSSFRLCSFPVRKWPYALPAAAQHAAVFPKRANSAVCSFDDLMVPDPVCPVGGVHSMPSKGNADKSVST